MTTFTANDKDIPNVPDRRVWDATRSASEMAHDLLNPNEGGLVTIQARYSGTCPDCGGRWQPGDLIRTETASGPPQWQHAVCPDDDPLEATHPVCQTCWLTHPEGACDRD